LYAQASVEADQCRRRELAHTVVHGRPHQLPRLQLALDRMEPGAALHLARSDHERLFCHNDAAHGRLKRFAAGRRCIAAWSDVGVSFYKNFPTTSASAQLPD
jgi:hypothetical protein